MPKTGRLSFTRAPGEKKEAYKQNPARSTFKCRSWFFTLNLNTSTTQSSMNNCIVINKNIKVIEMITARKKGTDILEGVIKFKNLVRKSFVTPICYFAEWKPCKGTSASWYTYFQQDMYTQQPRYYSKVDGVLADHGGFPPARKWKAAFLE